jgi:hypothetical protein
VVEKFRGKNFPLSVISGGIIVGMPGLPIYRGQSRGLRERDGLRWAHVNAGPAVAASIRVNVSFFIFNLDGIQRASLHAFTATVACFLIDNCWHRFGSLACAEVTSLCQNETQRVLELSPYLFCTFRASKKLMKATGKNVSLIVEVFRANRDRLRVGLIEKATGLDSPCQWKLTAARS